MNNPNSEPTVRTIRLTPAQRSALECAGLDMIADGDTDPEWAGLIAVAAAWGGDDFDVTPDTIDAVMRGLTDLQNNEDATAIEFDGDERCRRKAIGARTALEHLSAKVSALRDGDPREKGDDDGADYGDPRDEREDRRG